MWPFTQKKNNIVSITLNPQYMTCCWLNNSYYGGDSGKIWGKKIQQKQKIQINAYEKTEFKSLEFENATVFNPTKIGLAINNFIKKNKIKNPIISIAISGPSVFEKIITLQTSSPTEQDFIKQDFLLEQIGKTENIKFNYREFND